MTTAGMSDQLQKAVAGSSFYAGMRILPKAEHEAMFAIYGFCRLVDDIADDENGTRASRKQALGQWRADIDALYQGGAAGQAQFLRPAIELYRLEKIDFLDVIDGMEMDADADIRWPSFALLDLYCDRVASAVGRLSVNVFGMEREAGIDLALHLGRALQFTNILRDIDEDAAIGRVYLPMEALEAAGIAPSTPAALLTEPELDRAARWLAVKAQRHFDLSGKLLAQRPKGHLIAPRLMQMAYSRVLARMQVQGWKAPRRRIGTNKPLLALHALRLWALA